jgi:hypothetical protein
MNKDAKPHPVIKKAPDFTRTPWAYAHRKQRPQQKVKLHPKEGGKRKNE